MVPLVIVCGESSHLVYLVTGEPDFPFLARRLSQTPNFDTSGVLDLCFP